jgi:hypothetical protein
MELNFEKINMHKTVDQALDLLGSQGWELVSYRLDMVEGRFKPNQKSIC